MKPNLFISASRSSCERSTTSLKNGMWRKLVALLLVPALLLPSSPQIVSAHATHQARPPRRVEGGDPVSLPHAGVTALSFGSEALAPKVPMIGMHHPIPEILEEAALAKGIEPAEPAAPRDRLMLLPVETHSHIIKALRECLRIQGISITNFGRSLGINLGPYFKGANALSTDQLFALLRAGRRYTALSGEFQTIMLQLRTSIGARIQAALKVSGMNRDQFLDVIKLLQRADAIAFIEGRASSISDKDLESMAARAAEILEQEAKRAESSSKLKGRILSWEVNTALLGRLTAKERELLIPISQGRNLEESGSKVGLSEGNAKKYAFTIRQKLGIDGDLQRESYRLHLVPPPPEWMITTAYHAVCELADYLRPIALLIIEEGALTGKAIAVKSGLTEGTVKVYLTAINESLRQHHSPLFKNYKFDLWFMTAILAESVPDVAALIKRATAGPRHNADHQTMESA